MMELFDEPRAGENAPEFTVSEISGAVKRVVEGEFGRVRVRGEIGRISRHASGHVYFDLKDERACLGAVDLADARPRGLAVQPEEGMEVVATGRLTTFPASSKYQLVIEEIAPAGVGALMAMLEKRRQALAAEGLFDAARKRPLPYLPEVIGVDHLAVGRGDPRHPAPPARALPAPGAALAGDGAGRALRRRGRRGDPRLQRARARRAGAAARTSSSSPAAAAASRTSGASTRRSWCAPPPRAASR